MPSEESEVGLSDKINHLTSMDTTPKKITYEEYKEIAEIRVIPEMWGFSENWGEEELRGWIRSVYGVKFDFTSGCPGYCGDLYIIQGDALTGDPPVVLTRTGPDETLQIQTY